MDVFTAIFCLQATYLLDLTALEEEFVDATMGIARSDGLITACQLDVTEPIPLEIVLEMVENAAAGSMDVLSCMNEGADPVTPAIYADPLVGVR